MLANRLVPAKEDANREVEEEEEEENKREGEEGREHYLSLIPVTCVGHGEIQAPRRCREFRFDLKYESISIYHRSIDLYNVRNF